MSFEFMCPLLPEGVLMLEEYLCEMEASRWILLRVTEKEDYSLKGYFDTEDAGQEAWRDLRVDFPELPELPVVKKIEDKNWKNAYKQYLKPWASRGLHWVPIWEKEHVQVAEDEAVIYLDAGMAFGTGAHETTRLCAERLLDFKEGLGQRELYGVSVIDAGCGSGILALSAAALGFGNVRGFDIDPEAITVSEDNAYDNGIASVHFVVAGLEEGLKDAQADVVLANILANVLCANKELLVKAVKAGGVLVLSGILREEMAGVKQVFEAAAEEAWGGYEMGTHVMGEWVDVVLKRR